MIKVLVLVHRREGLTHEGFARGYEMEVGPAVANGVPGILRYAQNHHPKRMDGSASEWDGVGELWLPDLEAWERVKQFSMTPEGRRIVEIEAKYIDRKRMTILVADEKIMKAG